MKFKIIPFFIFFLLITTVYAQHSVKKKLLGKSIKSLQDTSQVYDGEFQLDFTEINNKKVAYFYDPYELNEIKELEADKNYKELLPTLEYYVSNFGIQNFHKD